MDAGTTEQAGFYRRKDADWAVEHPKPLCSACYQAEWKAKRDATREASAEVNAQNAERAFEQGYRMLTGTEKQVAWAYTIRQTKMDEARAGLESLRTRKVAPENADRRRALVAYGEEGIEEVANEPSAVFWIDSRHDTGAQLLQHIIWRKEEAAKAVVA